MDIRDLQVVLNEQGYAVWREMPRAAVEVVIDLFTAWKKGLSDKGEKEPNIFVNQSFATNDKRCPDFAIWGPDRLRPNGKVRAGVITDRKFVNPHVIFTFSWGNENVERKKFRRRYDVLWRSG